MGADATSTQDRVLLTLSAAALFVPAAISVFRQPYLYTVVLTAAAWASTCYHMAEEDQYEYGFQDMFYANLLIMILGFQSTLLWSLAVRTPGWYVIWNLPCKSKSKGDDNKRGVRIPTTWRLWVPFFLGGVSIGFYMSKGRLTCNPEIEAGCRPRAYNDYHIVWHTLSAAATAVLMWTRVENHLIIFQQTYVELLTTDSDHADKKKRQRTTVFGRSGGKKEEAVLYEPVMSSDEEA